MTINYKKIMNANIINILKDVLKIIDKEGIVNGHHLYITFMTNHPKVVIPSWLKEKYPNEITIIIQYEYYNLKIFKNYFSITLSFNNIKADLKIDYDAIISFADPQANFGLKIKDNENLQKNVRKLRKSKKNNVIDFNNYKKTN